MTGDGRRAMIECRLDEFAAGWRLIGIGSEKQGQRGLSEVKWVK